MLHRVSASVCGARLSGATATLTRAEQFSRFPERKGNNRGVSLGKSESHRSIAGPSAGTGCETDPKLMKPIQIASLVLTLSGVTLASAQAPDSAGPRRGPGGRGPSPVIRALDADKNGEISAAEIANAAAALRALDTDNDGVIAVTELRPARPAHAPVPPADGSRPGRSAGGRPAGGTRPVDPVMLALDADSDRTLSAAEIANAPRSVAALDANKDGKLTRDELRPLPPTTAN